MWTPRTITLTTQVRTWMLVLSRHPLHVSFLAANASRPPPLHGSSLTMCMEVRDCKDMRMLCGFASFCRAVSSCAAGGGRSSHYRQRNVSGPSELSYAAPGSGHGHHQSTLDDPLGRSLCIRTGISLAQSKRCGWFVRSWVQRPHPRTQKRHSLSLQTPSTLS